jgi:hypothetical protein
MTKIINGPGTAGHIPPNSFGLAAFCFPVIRSSELQPGLPSVILKAIPPENVQPTRPWGLAAFCFFKPSQKQASTRITCGDPESNPA